MSVKQKPFAEYIWEDVMNDPTIMAIEDFRLEQVMGKTMFYNSYKPLCDQLTGETEADYVNFWFQRDVLNHEKLVIRDSDCRDDLDDWAVELGCIPSLGEHQQGETNEEKQRRIDALERQKAATKAKKEAKRSAETPEMLIAKLESNLEKLMSKSVSGDKATKQMEKIERLQEKIEKLRKSITA